MLAQQTRDSELIAMVNNLLVGESSDFLLRLATALSHMNPSQRDALEALALELTKKPVTQASDLPVVQTDEDIEAQVAEYRRQLVEEKERAEKFLASQSDTGSGDKKWRKISPTRREPHRARERSMFYERQFSVSGRFSRKDAGRTDWRRSVSYGSRLHQSRPCLWQCLQYFRKLFEREKMRPIHGRSKGISHRTGSFCPGYDGGL